MEMISPNYMHISAYPLAMSKSTNGIISGEVVSLENYQDMNLVKIEFSGKLKGKIILVTGAGAGLGRQAALSFASHGATLILLGRTVSKLEATYDEILHNGEKNQPSFHWIY